MIKGARLGGKKRAAREDCLLATPLARASGALGVLANASKRIRKKRQRERLCLPGKSRPSKPRPYGRRAYPRP